MVFLRWAVLLAIGLLPPTRCYALKAWLLRGSGIKLGDGVRIVSSAKIWGRDISIGKNTFIGHEVLIANGDASVAIGSNVDIAPRVLIVSGSHELTPWAERAAGRGFSRNIVIGNGCWIGAGSIILGGVVIGDKAMVGAGALIRSNVPEGAVVVGNPQKLLKKWNAKDGGWERG